MTTLITRYFASQSRARSVAFELIERQRFSPRIVDLHTSPDSLENTGIDPDAVAAYGDRLNAAGGAVIAVRAGYKPLGVAKTTREVTAQMGAEALPGITQEVDIKDELLTGVRAFRDNPHMLTRPAGRPYKVHHMANWPWPLIIRRKKPFNEMLFPPHARMANFPFGLISRRKPFTGSIFPRHARMANFPIGLISRRKPFTGSIFAPHARMANFPLPLIKRRRPYVNTSSWAHWRMAAWPFPLLIDGEQGRNSLMPGGPRMAWYPMRLLSKRKPYTGSIVPRHGRMANFPIGLISRRKPFTGSMFPRHARMADTILPLVIRKEDLKMPDQDGFTLSRVFGLPTLIRR